MMLPQGKEHRQPPEAGKGKRRIHSWSLRWELGPADILTSGLWAPEPRGDASVLFEASQFVVQQNNKNVSPGLKQQHVHPHGSVLQTGRLKTIKGKEHMR